tara:strand:+ start:130 stop:321 length:192 start_codon:yes stop_codon:yes gene_type:complete
MPLFAYISIAYPTVYADIWNEFLEHLVAKTDKNVRFFPVQNNAVQIETIRSGRSHIIGFNTSP